MPGLFILIVGFLTFGTITYDNAKKHCAEQGKDHATKSCIKEELKPVTPAKVHNQ